MGAAARRGSRVEATRPREGNRRGSRVALGPFLKKVYKIAPSDKIPKLTHQAAWSASCT